MYGGFILSLSIFGSFVQLNFKEEEEEEDNDFMNPNKDK